MITNVSNYGDMPIIHVHCNSCVQSFEMDINLQLICTIPKNHAIQEQ